MWELDCEESWVLKNWCFWTVVLEKTLASPLNCKEISTGCSLEGLILKLKLQYFGHLMWRVDSLEKTLMLGGMGAEGEGVDRGWDGWMASPTRWTWVWVNSGSWWWTGRPGVLRFMGSQKIGHDWGTELNWLNSLYFLQWCYLWLHLEILEPFLQGSFLHFIKQQVLLTQGFTRNSSSKQSF